MAQYNITHSCGHNVVHQLYNSSAERDRKAAWLKTIPCTECKRAEELAQAQEVTKEIGLPALTGSDKQVAWATKIRAEAFASVDETVKDYVTRAGDKATPEKLAEFTAMVEKTKVALAAKKEAKFWIDGRGNTGKEWMKSVN